ncbi:hypothetical protein GCM10009850_006540 [Nonomuraea monospora]|uniref:Uncharacterized protein n=1 Tax=Nonomuraea monospora TaxID=568818 RepID=A0ABP5NZF8_9ACTN
MAELIDVAEIFAWLSNSVRRTGFGFVLVQSPRFGSRQRQVARAHRFVAAHPVLDLGMITVDGIDQLHVVRMLVTLAPSPPRVTRARCPDPVPAHPSIKIQAGRGFLHQAIAIVAGQLFSKLQRSVIATDQQF